MLSDGVCKAFAEAVKLAPELLTSLVLEENQFTDNQLGIFMGGVCHFTKMRQIVIKNNEVLEGVVTHLDTILGRPFPNNLDELRLISVKTSPYMITDLMETLSEQCLLRKISLVGC